MKIKFFKQLDENDCGPACLKMMLDSHGSRLPIQRIRTLCNTNQEGTSLQQLKEACDKIGVNTFIVKLPFVAKTPNENQINDLHDVPLPAILHWNKIHYVVLESIKANSVTIVDPGIGRLRIGYDEFRRFWIEEDLGKGYALLFDFSTKPILTEAEKEPRLMALLMVFIKKYLSFQKQLFVSVSLLIIASVALGLLTPYLTRSIIDEGLLTGDATKLWLILAGQVLIYAGTAYTNFVETKMAARLSQQLNATLVFDYLKKIMRLPLKVFDSYKTSDFLMRTYDFSKIDSFVSYNLINLIIAVLMLLVFLVILGFYSYIILLLFVFYQCVNVFINWYFLKRRKKYQLLRFKYQTDSFSSMVEIVEGLKDIRLSGSENYRLAKWQQSMQAYYKNNLGDIDVNRRNGLVSGISNNIFSLIITLVTANMLLDKSISLGTMVAIQFVVGQLNASSASIISSLTIIQDLRISFERINSINDLEEEKQNDLLLPPMATTQPIQFKDVSFNYAGNVNGTMQLNNINCTIAPGSITAIVGSSGSGKTTLLKLLLGFYHPIKGAIYLGDTGLKEINLSDWRSKCGVVMQDGYVFNESIVSNVMQETYREENLPRYVEAIKAAGLYDFIMNLPQTHQTIIGNSGISLSSGQKQRIFIARMIYRNPALVILDEATNQLDAITEQLVLNNMNTLFARATRIVVAHRMYAIQNAHNIIVLDNGCIVEQGSHAELMENKAHYYQLFMQQQRDSETDSVA